MMKNWIMLFFLVMSCVVYADSAHVVRVSNDDGSTEGYRVEVRDEDGNRYMTSRTYDKYTTAKKVAKKFNDKQEEGDGDGK